MNRYLPVRVNHLGEWMATGRRIWVTGPEGSGKTTFACRLIQSYRSRRFVVMRLRPDRRAKVPRAKAWRLEKKVYFRAGAEEVEVLTPPLDRIQKALETYMLRFYLSENDRFMLFEGEGVGDRVPCDVTVFVMPVLTKGNDPYPLRPLRVPRLRSPLGISEGVEALGEAELAKDEGEGEITAEVKGDEPKQLAFPLGGEVSENQGRSGYEALLRADAIVINQRREDGREDLAYTLSRVEKMVADRWDRRSTVHVCNLSDYKDPEFKKAIARIKRLL